MRFAVQPLTGTAATTGSSCKKLIDDLDTIDSKISDPTTRHRPVPTTAQRYYEIFKYFGGH